MGNDRIRIRGSIGIFALHCVRYPINDGWKAQVFAVAGGVRLCRLEPLLGYHQFVPLHPHDCGGS